MQMNEQRMDEQDNPLELLIRRTRTVTSRELRANELEFVGAAGGDDSAHLDPNG